MAGPKLPGCADTGSGVPILVSTPRTGVTARQDGDALGETPLIDILLDPANICL